MINIKKQGPLIYFVAILYFCGALGVFVWGLIEAVTFEPIRRGYVCGTPPTPEEALESNLPLYIALNPSYSSNFPPRPVRPLCLRGGTSGAIEDGELPPSWCYENVDGIPKNNDYWLYWSPCDDCGGTAWRIYNEPKHDESWFEAISEATVLPPEGKDAGWLRWSSFGKSGMWVDVAMSLDKRFGSADLSSTETLESPESYLP